MSMIFAGYLRSIDVAAPEPKAPRAAARPRRPGLFRPAARTLYVLTAEGEHRDYRESDGR